MQQCTETLLRAYVEKLDLVVRPVIDIKCFHFEMLSFISISPLYTP